MLNTLFPPVTSSAKHPTLQLSPGVLKSQRDGFFRYISAMDNNGKYILNDLRTQGARQGEEDGWPRVREAIDGYLRLANAVISQCLAVRDLKSLEEEIEIQRVTYKTRKAQSNVSFDSADTAPSLTTSGASSTDTIDKALQQPSTDFPTIKPAGSALERLTRELRKLGEGSRFKGLSKTRSNSALSLRSEQQSIDSSGEESSFDMDDRKRGRIFSSRRGRLIRQTGQD